MNNFVSYKSSIIENISGYFSRITTSARNLTDVYMTYNSNENTIKIVEIDP